MPAPLEPLYVDLRQAANDDLGADGVTDALVALVDEGLDLLQDNAERVPLESKVEGKSYFMFRHNETGRTSRPVNADLFGEDRVWTKKAIRDLAARWVPEEQELAKLHVALYSAAMSYCAGTDVTKRGDKKSPGTFFEIFVGHLAARAFQSTPKRSVSAPTLDETITLPTDFIFELGEGKGRVHLPVKTSTRERVVQVWAHQRVLDGMHGVNRFRGLLVVLTETNKQSEQSVVEVCLPGQWTAYQMYIAQLFRVYYLDPPVAYLALKKKYPFIQVKTFADFFAEREAIETPDLAT